MILPEREMVDDEASIMQGLAQIHSQSDEALAHVLAPEIIYTAPTGDVIVGKKAVLQRLHTDAASHMGTTPRQRLLQTPESLPPRTMVIDQLSANGTRSLLVLKRRAHDGLVSSLTEEEGHRKATVPLATRAGSNLLNSPTDMMVSPCTSKLNLAKRRHYMKAKPTNLFAGMTAHPM